MSDEDVELQSWGWTDLSSYSSSLLDLEKKRRPVSVPQTSVMSRVSLRLDDGLLDRSLPHSSASFSVGGANWKSSRSLKSRRSQHLSVSCSESLLVQSPLPPRHRSTRLLHNGSLHGVVPDTSLLSSLMDESSVQDVTLVDTMWGLDHDIDLKERTIVANSTLIGSESLTNINPMQTLNRVYCTDCELEPASRHAPSASLTVTGRSDNGESEASVIYHRDRSHRTKTGAMAASVWEAGVSVSRWAAACLMSLLALLHLQVQKCHHVTDVLQMCVKRAVACGVCALTHTRQVCRRITADCQGAGPVHCGTMKEPTTKLKEPRPLSPRGSLCDDCKGKQCSETETGPSSSWLLVATSGFGLVWSATLYTGTAVCEAFRWFSRRWCQVTAPNSAPLQTWFSLRLFLVLLPLLVLVSLCWFGPTGLQSFLAILNITEWRTPTVSGLSSVFSSMPSQNQAAEGAMVESVEDLPLYSRATPSSEEEPERLVGLERSLAVLWERVEAGGQWMEQRHGEVLRLFTDLQQKVTVAYSGEEEEELGPWISGVLDHQLTRFRRRLDEERQVEQQRATSRLDKLELQLQMLAAKTEDFQRREASSSPLPADVGVGVERQSHDALLSEVASLAAALEEVRRDVEGLSAFRDDCPQLNAIQQTISARVRDEVRTLVYGSQLAAAGGGADTNVVPESLLQWLSQRYVSSADLQEAQSSLELSILQNIDLRLEQWRGEEALRGTELQTAPTITKEDVHMIVTNALRRFSQDQTGLADFALESGGGSILSTRCSETYETKAALLSLFGVPLWYFSQSPRAVIQPDIQPGNCWAFRGSAGFLVIRLSMRILPTAFSLEHIPKVLAPSGTLRSAPQDFSVHGLDDEHQERGKLLGVYTYDQDGEALQTYAVAEENDQTFQIIEVRVLSNWGHEDYTCMYRFRVHGTPVNST